MNAKSVIRNLLLLLVVASIGYALFSDSLTKTATQEEPAANPQTRLVVYYFAQGKDCATCLQLPEYTRAALEEHFADQLRSGEIVMREVSVEEPANQHYITEYGLYSKAIVLSRTQNGQEVSFENLTRVWDLVGDREEFVAYIRDEVQQALGPEV